MIVLGVKLFSKLLNRRNASTSAPALLSDPDAEVLVAIMRQVRSVTGVDVTPLKAYGIATVFACVSKISGTMSTLPLKLMQIQPDGKRREAVEHVVHQLLRDGPTREMSGNDFREAMQCSLTLRGNAYAIIRRSYAGNIAEIVPVEPWLVRVGRDSSGSLAYFIREQAGEQMVYPSRMLHLRGATADGIAGISPVSSVREVFGLALVMQENAAQFFGNGSHPGGFLEHPQALSEPAQERMKKQFEGATTGNNRHRLMILEEGLKFTAQRMDNDSAQFLESRKYQNEEICRIFGIPPHKVGILDKATFSNIEQQNIEFVQDCILPWCVRWESWLNKRLLTAEERDQGYYFKHNINGLLRGSMKDRSEFYKSLYNIGAISPNEVRAWEDLDPYEGGDEYRVPLNMEVPGATNALQDNL